MINSKFKRIIIVSLVITLPLSMYFFRWLHDTLSLFYKLEYLSTWVPEKLYTAGLVQYESLLTEMLADSGYDQHSDINILVNKRSLGELQSDLPRSAKEDKKAILYMNDRAYKGKVRLRGDNYYHWVFPQASWRFKSSKKNLVNGIHKMNFIIPKGNELLNNHLAYKLAQEMDLLAPDSKLVTLSINNISNGIKLMVPQIDESFLRNNGRMPNDIYKGDNMGSKKVYGASIKLFGTPSIWDKLSYNNHYPKESRIPLDKMLRKDSSLKLDLDSFARFSAFIDLLNTYHYDDGHNWVFTYDNYLERMYPIVWDPVGWWEDWAGRHEVNILSANFLEDLHRNYNFLYRKYRAMDRFFRKKEKFLDIVDEEIAEVKLLLNRVRYTTRMDSRRLMDREKTMQAIDRFRNRIKQRLNIIENYYLGDVSPADYAYAIKGDVIRLSVSGTKMINKIRILADNLEKVRSISVSYVADGKTVEKPLEDDYKIDSGILTVKKSLLPNVKLNKSLVLDEATYDIRLVGMDAEDINGVNLEFLNKSRESLPVNKVDEISQKEFYVDPGVFGEQLDKEPQIWSGIREFQGFTEVRSDVVIKPGTKIILNKGATIKLMGRLVAEGTAENPIIFQAKDRVHPWGALVLKDQRADNSVLKYCIFKDGSGAKGNLYEYTGMLSVHNVNNLLVENCEFIDSHETDDMVHVVYSSATFRKSKFVRSLFDSMDVDISNVKVDKCEFMDGGNDAIDLMTSNAMVTNTILKNSRDKGISIGEGSQLLAINNYIGANQIGVQSKDTSKAYIFNTTFTENDKAVDAYHKNWRYMKGGEVVISESEFDNNGIDATVGKKSSVIISNSDFKQPPKVDDSSLRGGVLDIKKESEIDYELEGVIFSGGSALISKESIGFGRAE